MERAEKLKRIQALEALLAKKEAEEQAKAQEKPQVKAQASAPPKTKIHDAEEDELAELREEIEKEKTATPEKTPYERLLEFHEWLNQRKYEFMYTFPDPKKNKNEFNSWLDDWKKVIMDFAKVSGEHVLYPKNLSTVDPFRKFQKPKDALDHIIDALLTEKRVEWMDKKKEALRVLWRTRDEWLELVLKWARENMMTDPILVREIKESGEEFANLPDVDLRWIFDTIQKSGRGSIIQLSDKSLAIKIKFN